MWMINNTWYVQANNIQTCQNLHFNRWILMMHREGGGLVLHTVIFIMHELIAYLFWKISDPLWESWPCWLESPWGCKVYYSVLKRYKHYSSKVFFSKSNISLSQCIIIHYRGIIIYSISSTNNIHNILKLFQIHLEEKRHWPRLS